MTKPTWQGGCPRRSIPCGHWARVRERCLAELMMHADYVWSLPPVDISLSSAEVHVWRASLDLPRPLIAHYEQYLSPDELSRAARFYFERDRQHFVVGRGVLRAILGRYLAVTPDQLLFS